MSSEFDGFIIGMCPVCGEYIRHPESICHGPNRHRCSPAALVAIDRDRDERRRSGRNPARSVGERIEEGFRMMEFDD